MQINTILILESSILAHWPRDHIFYANQYYPYTGILDLGPLAQGSHFLCKSILSLYWNPRSWPTGPGITFSMQINTILILESSILAHWPRDHIFYANQYYP